MNLETQLIVRKTIDLCIVFHFNDRKEPKFKMNIHSDTFSDSSNLIANHCNKCNTSLNQPNFQIYILNPSNKCIQY